MRRYLVLAALLLVGLAGCASGSPPVIPTVAQLPTITPTEEVFFTPTPAETLPPAGDVLATELPADTNPVLTEAAPPPEDLTPPDDSPPPDDAPPLDELFASPTPEVVLATLSGPTATPDTGPCSQITLDEALAGSDLEALHTNLQGFMEALHRRVQRLDDWTLIPSADPFATVTVEGVLPQASLRFQRNGGEQEAFLLIARLDGPISTYFGACVRNESYYRQTDVSTTATITLEPLEIGNPGMLATITEQAGPEATDMGITELRTEIYAVLDGQTLYQFVNIPTLAQTTDQTPVTREEALSLLRALLDAARGL